MTLPLDLRRIAPGAHGLPARTSALRPNAMESLRSAPPRSGTQIASHPIVRIWQRLATFARLGGIGLLCFAVLLPAASACACAPQSDGCAAAKDAHACCPKAAGTTIASPGSCCAERTVERPTAVEPARDTRLSHAATGDAAPAFAPEDRLAPMTVRVSSTAAVRAASPPSLPLRI